MCKCFQCSSLSFLPVVCACIKETEVEGGRSGDVCVCVCVHKGGGRETERRERKRKRGQGVIVRGEGVTGMMCTNVSSMPLSIIYR